MKLMFHGDVVRMAVYVFIHPGDHIILCISYYLLISWYCSSICWMATETTSSACFSNMCHVTCDFCPLQWEDWNQLSSGPECPTRLSSRFSNKTRSTLRSNRTSSLYLYGCHWSIWLSTMWAWKPDSNISKRLVIVKKQFNSWNSISNHFTDEWTVGDRPVVLLDKFVNLSRLLFFYQWFDSCCF